MGISDSIIPGEMIGFFLRMRRISAHNRTAAFGGHPHQSRIGSEEPILDSFSLKGEAFGGDLHLLQQNKQCWTQDKASPLGETPQGGLSCPFGAIHLQLSAIGSSEPMAD